MQLNKYWRLGLLVGALIGTAWLWSALASAFFCFGIHRKDLLHFPFTQWLEATQLVHTMLWKPSFNQIPLHPLFWFTISPIIPSLLIALIVVKTIRFYRQKRLVNQLNQMNPNQPGMPGQLPLYGGSEWAKPKHMAANKIIIRRS